MSEEQRRILNMVKDGKISVEDAEELMAALDEAQAPPPTPAPAPSAGTSKELKYLRVQVDPINGFGPHPHHHGHPGKKGKVNVRIPLAVLRAGVKLTTLLPQDARAKIDEALQRKGLGLELSDLEGAKLEPLIEALAETSIDVDSEEATVKIYCE